ncbi:cold shock CspA family protein [Breznakia sp. PF5-3]|uniref:cold shock domain-containing protein n=1 Tax=unclassified Breznakia TaxID=2623764 RepID=UPI0024065F60|nr:MULTISPECIES: cold shock domain-containing protein [unclassified Breznakia]MDF9825841.1 cold shock CspA family protein [Breznakia sp. PM6-1]MDF9836031.1 cold shock CspA family protein [Breznakia sp. PF5-3]MDF9837561.1 cold shock CspA family protein [Breznakia sp. PFB2-8]MDF9860174.1 cold shock CspA family protein [Breznakia sp. PH5-24]
MRKGYINYFDKRNSFGFITTFTGEKVYFNASVIRRNKKKYIPEGSIVQFKRESLIEGNKVTEIK